MFVRVYPKELFAICFGGVTKQLGGSFGHVFVGYSREVVDFVPATGSEFFVFQLGKITQVVEALFKGFRIAAFKNMDFFIEAQAGACNAFRAAIE